MNTENGYGKHGRRENIVCPKQKKSNDCSMLDRSDLQIWWLVFMTDHGYGTMLADGFTIFNQDNLRATLRLYFTSISCVDWYN